MDHSLSKVRVHAVVGHLQLNVSKESIHSIESLLKNMKHTPAHIHIASKKIQWISNLPIHHDS